MHLADVITEMENERRLKFAAFSGSERESGTPNGADYDCDYEQEGTANRREFAAGE